MSFHVKTKSLSSPWGKCERGELQFGGNYTYSACVREQETLAMLNVCRCRDAYMPGYNAGDYIVISLTLSVHVLMIPMSLSSDVHNDAVHMVFFLSKIFSNNINISPPIMSSELCVMRLIAICKT